MDVANEPRAKPTSPVMDPVMQTILDPNRVIMLPIKMPAHENINSNCKSCNNNSKHNFTGWFPGQPA